MNAKRWKYTPKDKINRISFEAFNIFLSLRPEEFKSEGRLYECRVHLYVRVSSVVFNYVETSVIPEMSEFDEICARLALNETNLGLFKISLSTF